MNERIAQVAQRFNKAPEAPQPVEPLSKLQALKAKVGDFMGGLPEMPVPGELLEVGREKVEKGRDRVKDAMGHASEVLGATGAKLGEAKTKAKDAAQTGVSTTVEYFNDDEKGAQRKAVAAGVVGVAAMAGAYGVYRSRKESKENQAQTMPDASDDEKQQMEARIAELEGRLPKNGKKTSNELIADMREEMKDTIKKDPIWHFGDKLDEPVPQSRRQEAANRAKDFLARRRAGNKQPQPADPATAPTEPLPVTPPAPEPETAQHNV